MDVQNGQNNRRVTRLENLVTNMGKTNVNSLVVIVGTFVIFAISIISMTLLSLSNSTAQETVDTLKNIVFILSGVLGTLVSHYVTVQSMDNQTKNPPTP